MSITYREYWQEVRDVAASLTDGEADVYDVLNETIAGHGWVNHTWALPWVLKHSKSEDAVFDAYGSLEVSSYHEAMSKMAFAAMRRDVQNSLPATYIDEDADDEEGMWFPTL